MLTTEQLFSLTSLRDASLSPDGSQVAYCTSQIADETESYALWLLDLETNETRRIAFPGDATAPSWSADGKTIAFIGDGRLRALSWPGLIQSGPLTPETMVAEGQCTWAPDSRRLAVLLRSREKSPRPRRIGQRSYRAEGIGDLDGFARRLFQIDLSSLELTCLTPSESNCTLPAWAPEGSEILFLAGGRDAPFSIYGRALKAVQPDTGNVRTILAPPFYVEAAAWIPGGRIAVAGAMPSSLTVPTSELLVVERDGTAPSRRTPMISGNVGLRLQHDMPGRELTDRTRISVLGESAALVTVQVAGRAEIWRVSLSGEVACQRVLAGERSCIFLGAAEDGASILYAVTDFDLPPDLWHWSAHSAVERQITYLNDRALLEWPRFALRPFAFVSADGLDIEGWFISLQGESHPLPTILSIHAGPFLAAGHIFRFDILLLAAQGFGVILHNFRGSGGYGEIFSAKIMGDWGRNGFDDHLGAVDAVVAKGWAVPERLGVWGTSHGGFATCWMVTNCDRFKAAFAEAAITDFTLLYYLTDLPEVFERDLGGRPQDHPELYRDRSPITYAAACRTPTLLLHALDDERCPAAGARMFHRALQDAGCATALLLIEQGGHSCDAIGPLEAREAQNVALADWFGRHLLPCSDALPARSQT